METVVPTKKYFAVLTPNGIQVSLLDLSARNVYSIPADIFLFPIATFSNSWEAEEYIKFSENKND